MINRIHSFKVAGHVGAILFLYFERATKERRKKNGVVRPMKIKIKIRLPPGPHCFLILIWSFSFLFFSFSIILDPQFSTSVCNGE